MPRTSFSTSSTRKTRNTARIVEKFRYSGEDEIAEGICCKKSSIFCEMAAEVDRGIVDVDML